MDRIVIRGGVPLEGVIPIGGAKNASLPLMAASLLTDETLMLSNLPHLVDISTMAHLLAELGADLSRSWMVGDRQGDLQVAWNVGARGALVMTGYGRGELEHLGPTWERPPDLVAAHTLEAVEQILGRDA